MELTHVRACTGQEKTFGSKLATLLSLGNSKGLRWGGDGLNQLTVADGTGWDNIDEVVLWVFWL